MPEDVIFGGYSSYMERFHSAPADYDKVYTWWDNMLKLTYTPDTSAPGTTYTVRITNDTDPLSMMFGTGWAVKYEGTLILEEVPALS